MECHVKKEIEVTLKLSLEEFNTIVCAYGITSQSERQGMADKYNFKILSTHNSQMFFSDIKAIADKLV